MRPGGCGLESNQANAAMLVEVKRSKGKMKVNQTYISLIVHSYAILKKIPL